VPRLTEVRLTPEGRAELEAELARLEAERPEVAGRLEQARASGNDPAENLDLRDAMDALALLEGRIGELRGLLAIAELIDDSVAADGTTRLGSKVRVKHSDGEQANYTLVSAAEADPRRGRISVDSPIGHALLGHKQGDDVTAETPNGSERLTVLSVG
jgi:transcription elongation factor GreA